MCCRSIERRGGIAKKKGKWRESLQRLMIGTLSTSAFDWVEVNTILTIDFLPLLSKSRLPSPLPFLPPASVLRKLSVPDRAIAAQTEVAIPPAIIRAAGTVPRASSPYDIIRRRKHTCRRQLRQAHAESEEWSVTKGTRSFRLNSSTDEGIKCCERICSIRTFFIAEKWIMPLLFYWIQLIQHLLGLKIAL